MAAWEEGSKTIEKAELFAGGSFVLLLLVAIYCGAMGDLWNAAYFAVFSMLCLGLLIYVRRTFKRGGGYASLSSSTQRR